MHNFVNIKDSNGDLYKWRIEDETDYGTYKVFHRGLETQIYKNKCYIKDNEMYTVETRDVKFNNGRIALAPLSYIAIES